MAAKTPVRTAAIMTAFALVFTALLAFVHLQTRERVLANERQARLHSLAQVLPAGSYDNDLLRSARRIAAPELGPGEHHAYIARRDGRAVAVILESSAPDGYSGRIDLLVGIWADGRVSGVRVLRHKETPGLGDYIEAARSDWIHVFDGRSLGDPPAEGWRVRKDGGVFEHRAGATTTPRAVVKAVRAALEHVQAHGGAYWGEGQ